MECFAYASGSSTLHRLPFRYWGEMRHLVPGDTGEFLRPDLGYLVIPERGLRITEAELYRRVKSYQIISSIINTDTVHLLGK